jgi:hypothetical protein
LLTDGLGDDGLGDDLFGALLDLAHRSAARRARAVGVERRGCEVLRAILAPGHALTVPLTWCSRSVASGKVDCSNVAISGLSQPIG